jgi:hypothetical protein
MTDYLIIKNKEKRPCTAWAAGFLLVTNDTGGLFRYHFADNPCSRRRGRKFKYSLLEHLHRKNMLT